MRFKLFTILYFVILAHGYTQNFNVVGIVSDTENQPLKNASVAIKDSEKGVFTDKKGVYTLNVKLGDTLVVSYIGKQTVEFIIKKEVAEINIELLPKEEQLDSVLLKRRKAFTQKELLAQFPKNKNLIKTTFGIVNKDRASYAIRIIDGKDLIQVGSDFLYSLQNQYPMMRVIRNDANDPGRIKVYLQSWSFASNPQAIFDVDGVIYQEPPTFLVVEDIDRVAILIRNAAAQYGTAGAGGVIIINTKSGNIVANSDYDKIYDNSNLRDSLYQAVNAPVIYTPYLPEYIQKFAKAKTESRALALFEKQKKDYLNSPYYFIDASDYFFKKWGNKQKAQELLMHVTKYFPQDIAALKTVTFKFEEFDDLELAFKTSTTVLNLQPNNPQSQRDLSSYFAKLKNFKKSLNHYINYETTNKKFDSISFNSSEVGLIMKSELTNIIKLQGDKLKLSDKVINTIVESPKTRLLFEWNNNEADFETRIVNSDNTYYSWRSIPDKNTTIKQVFFDAFTEGKKDIQVIYHGNKSDTPTYLKVTLFFNYGERSQKSESRIYRLFEKGVNFQLLTFDVDKNSVVN